MCSSEQPEEGGERATHWESSRSRTHKQRRQGAANDFVIVSRRRVRPIVDRRCMQPSTSQAKPPSYAAMRCSQAVHATSSLTPRVESGLDAAASRLVATGLAVRRVGGCVQQRRRFRGLGQLHLHHPGAVERGGVDGARLCSHPQSRRRKAAPSPRTVRQRAVRLQHRAGDGAVDVRGGLRGS